MAVTDKFGAVLEVGDDIVYTYCQALRKGKVARVTRAGNVVVDNWPQSGRYIGGRYVPGVDANKSLGRYKECVKLTPTYMRLSAPVELTQKER